MGKCSDFHLSFFQKIGAWQDFTVDTKLMKTFKSLYGFGGYCLKIRDIWECRDFEPYFKVHNLVPFHPKSNIRNQITNLNMIFLVVVLVYWFAKILNLPQFPAEFRKGQLSRNKE